MRRTLSAVCFVAIFFVTIPLAFATDSTQDLTTSVRVTITAANVPTASASFTFDTSPNVSLSCKTSATNFAISCTNVLTAPLVGTTPATGNDYATLNTATGYAQKAKSEAVNAVVVPPVDEVTLPAGTWVWMGGDAGDAAGS